MTAPRIQTTGRDWTASPSVTPWQRERWSAWSKVHSAAFSGPERRWKSLAMWLAIGTAAFVGLAVLNG